MSSLRLAILAALAAAPARAAELVPMYNFSMIGGQYFFAGDKSHLNANVSANVTPAVKLDNGWTLLPIYNGTYRGTKSVTDSVGAGSLFQQEMSQRASLSGLYVLPGTDWKLKPSFNYKYDFLKETRDEAWGKGLFDYQKVGVGFEGEKVYKDPFSVRFSYDFYYVHFPNFASLESKSGVDPLGNPLGRETAGVRVLDTFNHQVTVAASRPYPFDDPKLSLQGSYSLLWQKFPDQPLVDQTGQYMTSNRQDFNQTMNFSVFYPRRFGGDRLRLNSGAQLWFAYNGSNQNTYDAGQTKYVPDAYSYTSVSFGPSFNLEWGSKKQPQTARPRYRSNYGVCTAEEGAQCAGLSFLWSRTQYAGRMMQDGNGAYQDDYQHQNRYLLSTGYMCPVAEHFRLLANANFFWATSNMTYEKTYKYTYNALSYLLGFEYDY